MVYLVLSNRRWESQKIFPKTRGSAWFCIEQYFSCFNIYSILILLFSINNLNWCNWIAAEMMSTLMLQTRSKNQIFVKKTKLLGIFGQAPPYMIYATGSIFHDEWLDNMFIVLASEYNKRNETTSGSKKSHWNM